MTFHSVPGNRRGAQLFTSDDGYYYNLRFSTGSKSHYTCHRTNCDARVWVYKDTAVANRNEKFPWHSHDTEHCLEAVNVLRETIIYRVQRESLPPKRIFDEECNKVPKDISKHLAFGQIESNLQKSRRKCFPRLPNSPVEFNDILMSYEWQGRFSKTLNGKTFYRQNVVIKGKNNLVFLPENMERLFETAEEIHMDGTFKMVPSVPGLKQLFVLMAISYDYAFPVCYILMDNRSYLSYKRIFAVVKDIVPQLNPKIIISDFESAMMKASKEEFPDAVITGCWWHYANRILKKATSLIGVHLLTRDDCVKKVMHMCMALPLLPQEKIEAGLAAVRETATETVLGTVSNAFTLLFTYIQSQWIQKVGADRLTVCSVPRRTNNDSELFNTSLKKEMGHAHPNAWAFVDGLKNIEDIQTTIFERIQNGLPVGRLRRRRFLSKEKVIKTAMQNLEAGRTTEREFLSTVAAFIGRKVNFQLQEDEDEEEDEKEKEEEEEDEDEEEVDIQPSPSPSADAHTSAAIGGEFPRSAKRKKSIDPDKKKKAKTQNTSDGAVASSSNQSSHIPECLGSSDSELSPSIRNKDTNPHIKEEGIKDELMLEDYDNSDGAFEESESNESAMEDSNEYASTSTDARVPFETVDCNGGFQVKLEIVEDESGDFEMAHEPESVTTTVKSTGTVNTTEPSCSGYLENTGEIDSLDVLARLSNTLGTTNKPSQDTGTLGYMIPTDVQTVAPSQPLVIAATTPNYIGVVMSDSFTVTNYSAATAINYNMAATTNFSAAITTNYSADAPATNCHAVIPTPASFTSLPANSATNASTIIVTNPSPISATNAPGQPPRDESSSCLSDCEDLEGVFISLKKVPVERRTKTKDKLLRLVKVITELDLDPDEVSFSVTTK